MSGLNKISIQVGEFEFESEGSQIEVDEKFARFKEEGFWNIISERLEEAKDLAEEGIPFAPLPWNDDKVN